MSDYEKLKKIAELLNGEIPERWEDNDSKCYSILSDLSTVIGKEIVEYFMP
jgi:hypothetical protein